MENTPRLYNSLAHVLSQHGNWLDARHLQTLAWMMVGLIESGLISLTAWAPTVVGRARYAQSTVRRFRRWLDNERIEVGSLYGPLIQQALSQWGKDRLYLALDTSMLWGIYCMVRISVIYRGRAIPLVWDVREHASSLVGYESYRDLLDRAQTLLPFGCTVVFLADRGFADTDLMGHVKRLGWHFRIRSKKSFGIYRKGQPRCKAGAVSLSAGEAIFWHTVEITAKRFGPVHLAMGRRKESKDCWFVISDEPTSPDTFMEYGLRFDIEENFLDDKSNGFQLESSLIRSADALSRLCFVVATATLYLVCQAVEVVRQGRRRFVDPHWFRGSSYLKIGWKWIKLAMSRGYEILMKLHLPGEPDPEPAIASRRYHQLHAQPRFAFDVQSCA